MIKYSFLPSKILLILTFLISAFIQEGKALTSMDLNKGESHIYTLKDGTEKKITVVSVEEYKDVICDAVRWAVVTVDVDGVLDDVGVGLYNLPKVINGVKLDAPVTLGYVAKSSQGNVWNIHKDVRLRFWDPDEPLLEPGTFAYPIKQRMFSSWTQGGNEPVYANAAVYNCSQDVYYHFGVDIGGFDKADSVVAATDGIITEKGNYAIGITDSQGWVYRYLHLEEFAENIEIGDSIKIRDPVGILGQRSNSGGWAHLHFGISKDGNIAAYPFLVEAYLNENPGSLIAIARPYKYINVGETAQLDGTNSICDGCEIMSYQWEFHDGTTSTEAKPKLTFTEPGTYSEILRVRDKMGREAVDFCPVFVAGGTKTVVHASVTPTQGVKPGQEISFNARIFEGSTDNIAVWDFGDISEEQPTSGSGYVTINHTYQDMGLYIVTIKAVENGKVLATTHLKVKVE
jgi:murein DD-endopeptidase MepM/ murein hydrolase activator NlpD